MNKIKRNFFISTILIVFAIIFTILVKIIDVNKVGVNETDIGFSTINKFIFETIGVNMIWYDITNYLGIISICIVGVYALIGLIEFIKRKSIYKVDKEIIILGFFYIILIFIYFLFEKIIINYRPILINNLLEASYPSSHTLMTIFVCGSSVIVNKQILKNKSKLINLCLLIIAIITVIGRLLSGVHWFTDIVGGILISSSLLMTFYSFIYLTKK